MRILFLSLDDFTSYQNKGIYTDLLREFIKHNHIVYSISPIERRYHRSTYIINENDNKILKLKIGNIQKTGFIEKGISAILLESIFIRGIKKYFYNDKFDLILYATPPVTFYRVVKFIKNRDRAKSYLMLKDIWPQGIVDLQALSKTGWKGLIYKYFRNKEKKLYKISDYIGCMSTANKNYILEHERYITSDKVEICPNSIEPENITRDMNLIQKIKEKYSIPMDRVIFMYGGNLGKPQGIDFIIECLRSNKNNNKVCFIIAGSGTEYSKLENAIEKGKLTNTYLIQQLPKDEYEKLLTACDVGLIFLDHRFTIPNFPSRLLSYMQVSIPVLAATDIHTDVGQVIEEGEFGFWCESRDIDAFNRKLNLLCDKELRQRLGVNARKYLETHYTAKHAYDVIIKHFI